MDPGFVSQHFFSGIKYDTQGPCLISVTMPVTITKFYACQGRPNEEKHCDWLFGRQITFYLHPDWSTNGTSLLSCSRRKWSGGLLPELEAMLRRSWRGGEGRDVPSRYVPDGGGRRQGWKKPFFLKKNPARWVFKVFGVFLVFFRVFLGFFA